MSNGTKVLSAIELVDGQPRPRRLYGIESLAPGKEPVLYAMSLDKSAIEEYLGACQRTTKPEHWRMVEIHWS